MAQTSLRHSSFVRATPSVIRQSPPMPDPLHHRVLEKLSDSIAAGSFVKLTLSQPRSRDGLRNVYARLVSLKDGPKLSLLFRFATRDETKNFDVPAGVERIGELLGSDFERAHLFTTAGDWQWRSDGTLKASRPAFTVAPEPAHDRQKAHAVASGAPFLQALGVTNASGDPRPGMADKLRQIQRFTEVLGHLVDDSPLREKGEVRVLDMGAGKGYLTFATREFFRARGIAAKITGIEVRADLVEVTNRVAGELGFSDLHFERGAIADFPSDVPVDLLIALHACDTATDDAIFRGIRSGASLIVTAPCCHQEIRRHFQPPPILRDVLKHGILAEREAELVTDGIRALLLEISGYKADVFEFISTEHTGKNLMIAATKRPHSLPADPLRKRLRELFEFYGLREQHLARLLEIT